MKQPNELVHQPALRVLGHRLFGFRFDWANGGGKKLGVKRGENLDGHGGNTRNLWRPGVRGRDS